MADPLKVVRTLDALKAGYAVFEADQVLTHGQLNGVRDWLDEQGRLTRVNLLGVGIVAGLRVLRGEANVTVTRGLGVTTDGDLLMQSVDTVYDQFRPYGLEAPEYAPFRRADATMFEMVELVAKGESDVLAQPLSSLRADLAAQVVVMLMESVEHDPDLCSGTDCDNLGRDAAHRVRLLLMRREDALTLLPDPFPLQPAGARATLLPELVAQRPQFDAQVASTAQFAQRVRNASGATLTALREALPLLPKVVPEVLAEMFASDPVPRWIAALDAHAQRGAAVQVWQGFLAELVDTWNELREALLTDDAVMLPSVEAFPKHLLLGQVGRPRECRTGLYPSPLGGGTRDALAEAKFNLWRLDAQLAAYAPPTDTEIRVTPSRGPAEPLGERAIPWFYATGGDPALHVAWSYRLSRRGQAGHNLGYRAAGWAESARARAPLAGAIASCELLRIEGHLGQPVANAAARLAQMVRESNLPIAIRSVLLHTERRHIVIKPPIRYTDLHRFSRLLRSDVAQQLDDTEAFTERMDRRAQTTATGADFSLPEGSSIGQAIGSARQTLATEAAKVRAPLAQTRYTAYRAAADWKPGLSNALSATGGLKATLGGVSRNDFNSPIDTLVTSNSPLWIHWLDEIIDQRDAKEDERLLFPRFIAQHPGVDHLGGAWRGGTFVLLYDDAGRVVGDLTLPYRIEEDDSDEPDEPPLTRPPIKPPVLFDEPFKFVRPIDRVVATQIDVFKRDATTTIKTEFQADYLKFFSESLKSFGTITGGGTRDLRGEVGGVRTGDVLLDNYARDVELKMSAAAEARKTLAGPLTDAQRTAAEVNFTRAQGELADAIAVTSKHIVENRVDVSTGAAADVGGLLGSGATLVVDRQASKKLGQSLNTLGGRAEGSQQVLIGNLKRFGRITG